MPSECSLVLSEISFRVRVHLHRNEILEKLARRGSIACISYLTQHRSDEYLFTLRENYVCERGIRRETTTAVRENLSSSVLG